MGKDWSEYVGRVGVPDVVDTGRSVSIVRGIIGISDMFLSFFGRCFEEGFLFDVWKFAGSVGDVVDRERSEVPSTTRRKEQVKAR
jgi:hypothetical protein